ncbi:hypothetical protein KUCAC02_013011 [Chaenocephalus aceratus]|uniref:Uncharacterized protein n=1 Tax=Chaenocephalus aceratus TaxID=36190 RepID=A0ACB9XEH5_CHAAC|nr:hypothetical protein KUCAC02_013011 [Chaenocephalus aceratus]
MGNGRGADKPRQIVVKFLRFNDKTAVMGRRNRLKGTNIFLNEDYPEAVRQKRKELIPAMKAERSKGNIAYISRITNDIASILHLFARYSKSQFLSLFAQLIFNYFERYAERLGMAFSISHPVFCI